MWSARARRGRRIVAAALLALAAVLGACNPYTTTGQLPLRAAARCGLPGRGELPGRAVRRAGWVTGHLRYADPSRPESGTLRLVVISADLTGAGIVPSGIPRGDDSWPRHPPATVQDRGTAARPIGLAGALPGQRPRGRHGAVRDRRPPRLPAGRRPGRRRRDRAGGRPVDCRE